MITNKNTCHCGGEHSTRISHTCDHSPYACETARVAITVNFIKKTLCLTSTFRSRCNELEQFSLQHSLFTSPNLVQRLLLIALYYIV